MEEQDKRQQAWHPETLCMTTAARILGGCGEGTVRVWRRAPSLPCDDCRRLCLAVVRVFSETVIRWRLLAGVVTIAPGPRRRHALASRASRERHRRADAGHPIGSFPDNSFPTVGSAGDVTTVLPRLPSMTNVVAARRRAGGT